MNKTIESLKDDIFNHDKIINKIIDNTDLETKNKIVLNVTELEFSFKEKTVTIYHYVEDSEYPSVSLSFDELAHLISSWKRL